MGGAFDGNHLVQPSPQEYLGGALPHFFALKLKRS